MDSEVQVREREAVLVVAKRTSVTVPAIGAVLGAAFGEVYGSIGSLAPAGPPFVMYLGMPEGERPFDIQICAPVRHAVEAPAGWRLEELPAGTFASLVHTGPYDTVGTAYEAMARWIPAHGLVVSGPPREVYLDDPDTAPDRIRTVVEFPVEQVPAAAAR